MKKLIDKDPFTNGTSLMLFETYNCDKCVKCSKQRLDGTFTNADEKNMPKCSIQRDIAIRIFCYKPIKVETVEICENFTQKGILCKYMKTERKRYSKKITNQTELF